MIWVFCRGTSWFHHDSAHRCGPEFGEAEGGNRGLWSCTGLAGGPRQEGEPAGGWQFHELWHYLIPTWVELQKWLLLYFHPPDRLQISLWLPLTLDHAAKRILGNVVLAMLGCHSTKAPHSLCESQFIHL